MNRIDEASKVQRRAYVGRFAPSPTGPLHFGSLVAALGSYLDARAQGGRWLLRIEDVDRARVQPGADGTILETLARCGLTWDGPVLRQSERSAHYASALERLRAAGAVYACGCTRREMADSALAIDGARIYAGTCRHGLAPGKTARTWRLRTSIEAIAFVDRLQGRIAQSVEREVGDFVLLRADGQFAYQLAVVVDDAEQAITDVVRGADLIDSTARQIYLQRLLGVPTPRYLHLPVALNAAGEKLAKQTKAAASGPADLPRAFAFLNHPLPAGMQRAAPEELLEWGRQNWDVSRLPRARAIVSAAD